MKKTAWIRIPLWSDPDLMNMDPKHWWWRRNLHFFVNFKWRLLKIIFCCPRSSNFERKAFLAEPIISSIYFKPPDDPLHQNLKSYLPPELQHQVRSSSEKEGRGLHTTVECVVMSMKGGTGFSQYVLLKTSWVRDWEGTGNPLSLSL